MRLSIFDFLSIIQDQSSAQNSIHVMQMRDIINIYISLYYKMIHGKSYSRLILTQYLTANGHIQSFTHMYLHIYNIG